MSILEVSLETRCCALLVRCGADPVKRGQEGEFDREVFWGGGLHFWVEFKSASGALRSSQRVWVEHKKPRGDQHYVVNNYAQMERIVAMWEVLHGAAIARKRVT